MDFVRRVRRNPPRSARAEIASLVGDAERDGSADNHPELLVLVAVLGYHAPRIELHDCQGTELSLDGARGNAIPDVERLQAGEVVEEAHLREEPSALRFPLIM